MIDDGNITCKAFEAEALLFIDKDLQLERIEFWNDHLNNCSECKEYFSKIESVLNISEEELREELLDTKYNRMIERAVNQNRSKLFEWLFPKESEKGKIAIALKIAVVSALTVFAIIISLMTNKPNPIKTVSNDFLDWEGAKVNRQISEVKDKIDVMSKSDWDKQVILIDKRIKKLEKESDKFSFN
jgi:hypothetical protein